MAVSKLKQYHKLIKKAHASYSNNPILWWPDEFQNEIIFGDLKNKEFYTVNVVRFDEKTIDDKTGEIKVTNFSYVTSLKINSKNKFLKYRTNNSRGKNN